MPDVLSANSSIRSMLHHANVDRLIALWQAIYFNSTHQTTTTLSTGQFATPRRSNITADSPLKPFYRDADGAFHTGVTVASPAEFGYTYPEIDDWSLVPADTSRAVTMAVSRLYGESFGGAPVRRRRPRGLFWAKRAPPPPRSWKEYSVKLNVDRADLDLPTTIHVYVGDRRAGQITLLDKPAQGRTYGDVPLNRALGLIGDQDADGGAGAVMDTLERDLNVEIQMVRPPSGSSL